MTALPLLALAFLPAGEPQKKLLLIHYMPWFEAKPTSKNWGWHWTMNKMNPDLVKGGKREIASHYYPAIGPYDSSDPDVIEYHVQLMKLSGMDGVLLDWYGNVDLYDYGHVHRSTQKFIEVATKAGLKFALVYEDRTVANLIKEGKFDAGSANAEGNKVFRWVEKNWFSKPNYIRVDGRPLLLVFGPEYYKGDAWNEVFAGLLPRPIFLTLDSKQGPADGAQGWPQGEGDWRANLDSYYKRSAEWPVQIPPAFPRFHDFYAQADVSPSWGNIPDEKGKVYRETLLRGLKSKAPAVQLVTWNDWGEGTSIEPSVEFGNRDLEATQEIRRTHLEAKFKYTASDLKLPLRLFNLRKSGADPVKMRNVSDALLKGDVVAARRILE